MPLTDDRHVRAAERSVDSDQRLVLRARAGDRRAFSVLVDRYERTGLAVAMSVLHCSHDARDAVQDSFVAAYERLNSLWSPQRFGAWFLRIVRRQSLWHLRRRTARARHLAAIAAEPARARDAYRETSNPTMCMIARLPEQEALVVSLRHLDERSVAEISEMTRRPVGTVTKQLSRAYARMRSWLDAEEVT